MRAWGSLSPGRHPWCRRAQSSGKRISLLKTLPNVKEKDSPPKERQPALALHMPVTRRRIRRARRERSRRCTAHTRRSDHQRDAPPEEAQGPLCRPTRSASPLLGRPATGSTSARSASEARLAAPPWIAPTPRCVSRRAAASSAPSPRPGHEAAVRLEEAQDARGARGSAGSAPASRSTKLSEATKALPARASSMSLLLLLCDGRTTGEEAAGTRLPPARPAAGS